MPDPRSVGRPFMPGYGLPEEQAEFRYLLWEAISAQLAAARNYWIVTTRPDGKPHATPVWGLWLDEAFYFSCGKESQKARNLRANPALVVHLESGDEVVILEGRAEMVTNRRILQKINQAYDEKYSIRPLDLEAETPSQDPFFTLILSKAMAWLENDFVGSATRWLF